MKMIDKIRRLFDNRSNVDLFIKGGGKIGQGCFVFPDVVFGSEPYLIEIGDNVRLTSGVKFVTHDGGMWVLRHLYKELENADLFGRIVIGDNVHIGWDTIIMPGVTIGSNCVIGCASVVTHDIPSGTVAAGVPARPIKTIEQYKDSHIDSIVNTKKMSSEEKKRYLIRMYYENETNR